MKYKVFKDKDNNLIFDSGEKQIAIPLKQIKNYNVSGKHSSNLAPLYIKNTGVLLVGTKEKEAVYTYVIGLKEYEEKISRNKRKITRIYRFIEIKNVENQVYVSKKLAEFKIKFEPVVVKEIEKLDKDGKVFYKYVETK